MGGSALKDCTPQVFGHSDQLLFDNFFEIETELGKLSLL